MPYTSHIWLAMSFYGKVSLEKIVESEIVIVTMDTCWARHSDVYVDILFIVKFCRYSECRFTVTSVVTEEKSATL